MITKDYSTVITGVFVFKFQILSRFIGFLKEVKERHPSGNNSDKTFSINTLPYKMRAAYPHPLGAKYM